MEHVKKTPLFIPFILLCVIGISACNNNKTPNDSSASSSAEEKARELVSKMSLEQKVAQLHGASPAMEMTDEAVVTLFEDTKKDPSLLLMPRRVDTSRNIHANLKFG